MAKEDVTFTIGVDSKDAIKGLKKFDKDATRSVLRTVKSTEKLRKSFDGIGKNAANSAKKAVGALSSIAGGVFSLKGAITGLIAGAGLVKFIDSVTSAAAVQETAIKGLTFALDNSTDSSRDALEGFERYASALQDSTGLADETAISIIGLAKSFGASDKSAKDFATASIELAAVTGKTVEETSRQLVKSLGGLAGELGEISPIFKSLTAEQLKAGGAARAVIDNFSGAAAAQLDTFAGSISALGGRFGDLSEAVGRIITENPTVARIFGEISEGVKSLTSFIDDNAPKLQEQFSKALIEIVRASGKFVKLMEEIFGDLSIDNPFSAMEESAKAIAGLIEDISDGIRDFKKENAKIARQQVSAGNLPAVIDAVGSGGFGAPDRTALDITLTSNIQEETKRIAETIKSDLGDNLLKRKLGITIDTTRKTSDNIRDFAQELEDALKESVKEGIKLPKPKRSDIPDLALPGANTAAELGTLQDLLKQRKLDDEETAKKISQGRRDFVKSLVSNLLSVGKTIADTFLSAISGGFFDAISKGVDALVDIPRGFAASAKGLEQLVKQAPKIIKEIIAELPKIIDSLIKTFSEEFPKLVKEFAKALPVIIKQLTKALKSILGTIFEQLPSIFASLLDGLDDIINALPEILGKLFDQLPAIVESIVKRLPKIISSLFNVADDIAKGFADAIPGMIEALAESGDELALSFIEGILGSMGEVGAALIESFLIEGGAERVVGSILRSIPRIIVAVVQGMVRGITRGLEATASLFFSKDVEFSEEKLTKIFDNFIRNFKEGFRSVMKDISRPFQPLITTIKNLLTAIQNVADSIRNRTSTTGGFIGQTASNIGKANPLRGRAALGGTIPPGFPGDNFPSGQIGLQSGELVIPRNDVSDLRSFLAEQRRGTGALVGSEEMTELLATIAGNTSQGNGGTITLNEDGLTELLLDFSRRNERTQVA